ACCETTSCGCAAPAASCCAPAPAASCCSAPAPAPVVKSSCGNACDSGCGEKHSFFARMRGKFSHESPQPCENLPRIRAKKLCFSPQPLSQALPQLDFTTGAGAGALQQEAAGAGAQQEAAGAAQPHEVVSQQA